MKKSIRIILVTLFSAISWMNYAQERSLQFIRPAGQDGVNVFESPKEDTVNFEGVKVHLGGAFAIQFQALSNENSEDNLTALGSDFNLPTANLDLDAQLYDGIRMHLRTYLSSRNHQEAWVKGGHIQIDKLDFVKPGFLEGLMESISIRIGLDEFNYGDAHFRRTDNAHAIYNPFVGNYIMDSFSTEAFGEVTIQHSGFLGVIGLTNGKLNQNVTVNENTDNKPSFYGKLGYDNYVADDLRLRLTGSLYTNKGTSTGNNLYGGDRAGSRYYNIMTPVGEDANFAEGRYNPRFTQLTAVQVNPFIKYKGLELFGVFEIANNSDDQGNGSFTQTAGELIYRFGMREQLYFGGRYNVVNGERTEGAPEMNISRTNIGAGWFLTKNILTKVEYVRQKYEGAGFANTKYAGGAFQGLVIEAAIGF
ncbi:MAG: hypothetical protein WD426_20095 [Anditalea sp.]